MKSEERKNKKTKKKIIRRVELFFSLVTPPGLEPRTAT